MKKSYQLQSARLYYRPLELSDVRGMFRLDSNPRVHEYLGRSPLSSIKESEAVIHKIQGIYERWGIGRYATLLQETDEFIGWSGLSWAEEPVYGDLPYYDLGYRLIEEYWGKGYGYEAAQTWLDFGLREFSGSRISGYCDARNIASGRILAKVGMQKVGELIDEGDLCDFYHYVQPGESSAT